MLVLHKTGTTPEEQELIKKYCLLRYSQSKKQQNKPSRRVLSYDRGTINDGLREVRPDDSIRNKDKASYNPIIKNIKMHNYNKLPVQGTPDRIDQVHGHISTEQVRNDHISTDQVHNDHNSTIITEDYSHGLVNYGWIEKLSKVPITDGRHRLLWLVMAPYYVNIVYRDIPKEDRRHDATIELQRYFHACDETHPSTLTDDEIDYYVDYCLEVEYYPPKWETFKEIEPYLAEHILKEAEKYGVQIDD